MCSCRFDRAFQALRPAADLSLPREQWRILCCCFAAVRGYKSSTFLKSSQPHHRASICPTRVVSIPSTEAMREARRSRPNRGEEQFKVLQHAVSVVVPCSSPQAGPIHHKRPVVIPPVGASSCLASPTRPRTPEAH